MPDSIRELLQGIAGDEPGPSGDLAAGAYRRARRIGRRRFAAAAVAAITGLALASATTAALVNANGVEDAPPADGATGFEESTDSTTAPDEAASMEYGTGPDDGGENETCDGTLDWPGWGPSHSFGDLGALPKTLLFEVRPEEVDGATSIVQFDLGSHMDDQGSHMQELGYDDLSLAPDGSRYIRAGSGECDSSLETFEGSILDGVGSVWPACRPSWSPSSDQVVLNAPGTESVGGYVLDVATGSSLPLPEEIGCSPRWSADGRFLVGGDGTVAMPLGGGGELMTLAGAAAWTQDTDFIGLSSISADLTRACLEYADDEDDGAGTDAVHCDKYVDTATGAEMAFPFDAMHAQVVFMLNGSMIVSDDRGDEIAVVFVDADGTVKDERILTGLDSGTAILRSYFTG